MTKSLVTYEQIEHPMENIFEIEPGTTEVQRVEVVPTELVPTAEYDDKDAEIEKQFQEVYDAAMVAFETTSESIDTVEPKYRARNEEVAVQYLNTALSAANAKAALKTHKDKIAVAKGKLASGPSTVNNNLIVADRNDLLKKLMRRENDDVN